MFWWVVIVYSMIVLMWIYVFQFEDILDRWQNFTGMTDTQCVVHAAGIYRVCQKMTQFVFVRTSSNLHQI